MANRTRIVSVVVTVGTVVGGIAIGGGVPPSPAHLARAAGDAADNTSTARANTVMAVESTEALATIARNVYRQLETSRRMLTTQLEIERSSRTGLRHAKTLVDRIARIRTAIQDLAARLADVAALSQDATASAEASERAADDLAATLRHLGARFDVVTRESRELNRKARGYRKLRDKP
jgi:methyl-accepting chemotaxis protein